MNFDKWARSLADEMGKKLKEEEVGKEPKSKILPIQTIDKDLSSAIDSSYYITINTDGTITHHTPVSKDLGGTEGFYENPLFSGKPNPNVRPEDMAKNPYIPNHDALKGLADDDSPQYNSDGSLRGSLKGLGDYRYHPEDPVDAPIELGDYNRYQRLPDSSYIVVWEKPRVKSSPNYLGQVLGKDRKDMFQNVTTYQQVPTICNKEDDE